MKGFSLLEVLIALAIMAAVVMTVIVSFNYHLGIVAEDKEQTAAILLARAKIDDPATGGFFHRMGDLGGRDSQGRIWFCGRKSHRVETGIETLFTIPCEAVFNALRKKGSS